MAASSCTCMWIYYTRIFHHHDHNGSFWVENNDGSKELAGTMNIQQQQQHYRVHAYESIIHPPRIISYWDNDQEGTKGFGVGYTKQCHHHLHVYGFNLSSHLTSAWRPLSSSLSYIIRWQERENGSMAWQWIYKWQHHLVHTVAFIMHTCLQHLETSIVIMLTYPSLARARGWTKEIDKGYTNGCTTQYMRRLLLCISTTRTIMSTWLFFG